MNDFARDAAQRKIIRLNAEINNAGSRFEMAQADSDKDEADAALDDWETGKLRLRQFEQSLAEYNAEQAQAKERNAPRPAREHEELREVPLEKMTRQERFNWYAHEAGIKKEDTKALNEFEKNYVAGEEWAKKTRVKG